MDLLSKKILAELEHMQQAGRLLRNMSLARMAPVDSGGWQPPLDVYEGEDEFYIYCDLAGADRDSLSVIAEEHRVRISGRRQLPPRHTIVCVHQLEIELGPFNRVVSLPAAIDVDRVTSTYQQGILIITMPKKQRKSKVNIRITPGE
ncbi:Hsp20/alpha crystallin family protein [Desulfolithobacter sp.]